LLQASVFNYKRLDILRDLSGHPSKKLLSFDFAQNFFFQFRVSRYTTRHNQTSEKKVFVVWICSELLFSISSVSIYYSVQSDIRVKCYCHLNLLRASIFDFERLDILRHTIGHLSKKLLSFEFSQNICFQFWVSQYLTGLNSTSELKVIAFLICSVLLFWISSDSIYYGTQSDIRVKCYCRLNLLRAFVFNFEHLDILRDSIGHPSKKSLSFEFAQNICFQFWASQCITGLNPTSELKVIIVRICSELLFSNSSVTIYFRTQSDIRVKSYCHLNLLGTSVFNLEHLDILRDTIGHPRKNLLSFEFSQCFCFQFRACQYITGHNRTSE